MITTSMQSTARDLAAAVQSGAVRAGQQTPSVRGADWRSAVVSVVHGDGTIDTTDGLLGLRCLEAYTNPTVGDIIHVSQSGSGAWRADGRLSDGSSTSDTWHTPTLLNGWINFTGTGYQAARYHLAPGGIVMIQGVLTHSPDPVSNPAQVLFTLPAGYRPPATVAWPAISTSNSTRQIEVNAAGDVRAVSLTASTAVSFITITGLFTNF